MENRGNAPAQIFFLLLLFEVLLVAAHWGDRALGWYLGDPVWIIRRLVDLNGEMNIPTWFSSLQLAAIGGVFGYIWYRHRRLAGSEGPVTNLFLLAGLGFLFLSLDESAGVHESVSIAFEKTTWLPRFSGDHGLWIPIYGVLGITALVIAWRQIRIIRALFPRLLTLFSAGVAIVLAGAVGVEIITYEFIEPGSMNYALAVSLEEFCEMFGASVILYSALRLQGALERVPLPSVADTRLGVRQPSVS
ncbi:hypothetical protein [Thiohalomonas denitrificans]|uniref:Uncharacterized protein n=1 Tax=Thiohalomonas denitrificans TaxID=415747 RepID=A0A1G5PUI3_9GAMM|nr:hypothetical protein [Thiohalomonas denitrificans]SCZ53077.1 hypothetical protein SAMN03097708_00862 [Thiohalomonas denitrificans]